MTRPGLDALVAAAAIADQHVQAALEQIADGADTFHRVLATLGTVTPRLGSVLPIPAPELAARAVRVGRDRHK
ncbi:hypothetical protein [Kitasatospora sp. NPDC058478]|uniref:hypothetical protein n=1 Tax=unclassified Kitasatospora TaxID=2633591 RepID=UPI00365C43D5